MTGGGIEAFEPQEYWSIEAELQQTEGEKATFSAKLHKAKGKKIEISNQEKAEAIVEELKKAPFVVQSEERMERRRNPAPPFTTSSLQQEATSKLGFTAMRTMRVAQQLYEGGGGSEAPLV